MAKRAALYLRVSTGEQTTENQRRELEEVAQRSGWKIVAVYERAMISERVRAGLERVRANGPAKGNKAIGGPYADPALAERVRQMRADGIRLLRIGRTLGIGTGLAQRLAYTPVCQRTEDLQAQALGRSPAAFLRRSVERRSR